MIWLQEATNFPPNRFFDSIDPWRKLRTQASRSHHRHFALELGAKMIFGIPTIYSLLPFVKTLMDHRHRAANGRSEEWSNAAMIMSISAVTLATHNMASAVAFYRMLGFEIVHGGDGAGFASFLAGTSFLNLVAQPAERNWSWWGRVIFHHSDVDTLYASVIAAGYRPDTAPRDAEWGERFFHLTDPDGHELSFAWPLQQCEPAGAAL